MRLFNFQLVSASFSFIKLYILDVGLGASNFHFLVFRQLGLDKVKTQTAKRHSEMLFDDSAFNRQDFGSEKLTA